MLATWAVLRVLDQSSRLPRPIIQPLTPAFTGPDLCGPGPSNSAAPELRHSYSYCTSYLKTGCVRSWSVQKCSCSAGMLMWKKNLLTSGICRHPAESLKAQSFCSSACRRHGCFWFSTVWSCLYELQQELHAAQRQVTTYSNTTNRSITFHFFCWSVQSASQIIDMPLITELLSRLKIETWTTWN